MTEKNKNQDFDMQKELLSGLEAQLLPLERQFLLLSGQVALQKLFVNVRALPVRELLHGVYDGRPAAIEVAEVMTDNESDARGVNVKNYMRLIVSAEDDKTVLCDAAITRPQDSDMWRADVGDYLAQVTRDGGNPGIRWRKASELVDGVEKQPAGLAPEIQAIIQMVDKIVKK